MKYYDYVQKKGKIIVTSQQFMVQNIELHITNACTGRCPYCYVATCNDGSGIKFGDFDKIKEIVGRLGRSDVASISLLGGDPVLHPRFVDLIKLIRENGMGVVVMSNSMEVKGYDYGEVSKYIDEIATTIHGRNATEHDEFSCSPGAYEKLINNLKKFGDHGVPIDVAINIIPETYNNIYEMVSNLLTIGVKVRDLLTQRILPYGRACNTTRWIASCEQVNVAFAQAVRCEEEFGIGIRVEDPYPFCEIETRFHKYMHGCPEGVNRIAMNMDGYFSRCGADPNYSKYNIFDNTLDEVWNKSGMFQEFGDGTYLLQECLACQYLRLCRGGCPIDCIQCNALRNNYIRTFHEGYPTE